ncbi:MAG: hypothetical protein ABI468_07205 [Candidatus Nanopelagicales bacterium]
MFQLPGQCPSCENDDLVRKGGKDQCPTCHYLQPCCDGGDLCGVGNPEAGAKDGGNETAGISG